MSVAISIDDTELYLESGSFPKKNTRNCNYHLLIAFP